MLILNMQQAEDLSSDIFRTACSPALGRVGTAQPIGKARKQVICGQ